MFPALHEQPQHLKNFLHFYSTPSTPPAMTRYRSHINKRHNRAQANVVTKRFAYNSLWHPIFPTEGHHGEHTLIEFQGTVGLA